jgi:hypothetical protein
MSKAIGTIVVGAPSDHAVVDVLTHGFEFIADNDTVNTVGHVPVQRGVHQNAAVATGRITVACSTMYSSGTFVFGGKTYNVGYEADPENGYYISGMYGQPDHTVASAIETAITINDGVNYTATAGGPDGNGYDYVDIVADAVGSAWNGGSVSHNDLTFPGMSGGLDDQVNADSAAVVALALAAALNTRDEVVAATRIDTATVYLIAKAEGAGGDAVITIDGAGLTKTDMTGGASGIASAPATTIL